MAPNTQVMKVIIFLPMLIFGCGRTSINYLNLESTAIAVVHTSPASNVILKTATTTFQWTISNPANLRPTDPYQVKVYGQAACSGTALSTSFVSASQYNLTGLMHAEVKSIGVIAFYKGDIATAESCSNSVTGNAIISQLQTTGTSYLALDVDFANAVAYVGSNYTGSFFDAYDFSDEANPFRFKSVGASTTPSSTSTYSRGVALYKNGQRLVVASEAASKVELWELTGNPRTGTWVKLSEVTSLTAARKISKIDTSNPSQTRVYVALRRGVAILNIAEPSGTMTLNKKSGTLDETGSGAVLGNWLLAGRNYTGVTSLIDMSIATPAVNSTYSVPATSTGSILWTSSTSTTAEKAFVGGQNGGFFTFDPLNPTVAPVMTYRFSDPLGTVARDSMYVIENGKELLYVSGQSKINVWDTTNAVTPVMTGQLELPSGIGESYGVRINPTTHRGYVTTNSGWFFIFNSEMIPAPPTTSLPVAY